MWYYQQGNNRMGPVDEATIRNLMASGTISIDTLVWTNGMASWVPLQQTALGSGLPVPPVGSNPQPSTPVNLALSNLKRKNRTVYILLALFIGNLGVHNFYAGRNTIAIIQLVINLCSLCTILLLPLFLIIHLGLFVRRVVEMVTVTKDSNGVEFH